MSTPSEQLQSEPILEPELPIVDAHHHMWTGAPSLGERAGRRYLMPELLADMQSGHAVEATIFVQCGAGYYVEGPEELRPVGETEFILREAQSAPPSLRDKVCAGIVAYADLSLGASVEAVLEAHHRVAQGRLRGIRQVASHTVDPTLSRLNHPPAELFSDRRFREGFARLAPLGLVFDAMVYHPQLDEVADLAATFPETTVVLDHCGGFLGVGKYASDPAGAFADWQRGMKRIAALDNVKVKIGGVGNLLRASPVFERNPQASVAEIAADWRPFVAGTLELFGPARCMFESNFPVDNATCSYARLWNVFKVLSRPYSAAERAALFSRVARETYRL